MGSGGFHQQQVSDFSSEHVPGRLPCTEQCPASAPAARNRKANRSSHGTPLVLASVVVYINGVPSESCHGLLVCDFPARTRAGVRDMDDSLFGHHIDCDHRIFLAIVRDSYVLHVELNHPVRLSCLEIPLDSSPLKGPRSAFRPSFERLGVRPEKKVVALYDIRDRRAAGNLVLLVIPQEYGPDFLCRVCRVLLPDSSYLLHDFSANSLPPHPLWSAWPVLKPGNPMLLEAPVPAVEV